MEVSTIMTGIRNIFAGADSGIYLAIGALYELIDKLARVKLISNVSEIQNKLYSFVAIFMLFKISFSIINYIINPESISDKEKGGSKMIVNVVITFALIIVAPFGFSLLYEAQDALLDDRILTRIILGNNDENIGTYELSTSSICTDGYNMPVQQVNKTGDYIAMMTYRPFIQIDSANADESQIEGLITKTNYCKAKTINELLDGSIINHSNKKIYTVNYNIILSTIVGIIILLLFTSFCFDVALRSVKLAFLQIIAPIPIMSYIDPKTSKNGMFSKWLKEVGITWVDLFLRLSAVYFAVFLISTINLSQFGAISGLLMLIGTLMFAKKLPEILKKIFNIDLKGDFKLNPLKKIEEQALGGKQITGVTTGVTAGTLGMITSFRGNNFKEKFANAGKAFKAGLIGGYKAPNTVKGFASGMQPYKEVRKKQKEANQQLKQFDEFNERGRKLVKDALLKDENGNYILDEDGKYKIDETSNFDHDEYINSFNNVKQAKGNLKLAREDAKSANTDLQRIASGNLTDDERKKIKSGEMTYNDLYGQAKENASKAEENVNKMQGILDGAKERHKIVQSKYTDDAMNEKSMKEYIDRHPDKKLEDLGINVNNANVNTSSINYDQPNEINANQVTQSANVNHYNNDPYGVYSELENTIKQKEAKEAELKQQYNKTTDMDKKNKISSEISQLSQEIGEAKKEREDFHDENPSVAADYIGSVVIPENMKKIEEYEKEKEALYNTFKTPDESVKNYGSDYAANKEYLDAKRLATEREMQISAIRSTNEDLVRRIKEFRKRASQKNQESEEVVVDSNNEVDQSDVPNAEQLFDTNVSSSSNSSEINKSEREKRREYLEDEKRKYLEEIDELRKYYGVTRYKNNIRYPEIEKKIKEIEDELYGL